MADSDGRPRFGAVASVQHAPKYRAFATRAEASVQARSKRAPEGASERSPRDCLAVVIFSS
jgi:hypothetical protein